MIEKISKGFNDIKGYNKVLFETENFKVIPSLGSLIEGWLLIVPKNYYLSFGKIANDDLYNELELLLECLHEIVSNEYGPYILFEHGPSNTSTKVGCGVDYAHLHLVPTCIDLMNNKTIKQQEFEWKKVPGINYSLDYSSKGLPYLFYKNQNHHSFITSGEAIPSQLFRRAAAEELGISEKYDWKEHLFMDNIIMTIDKYSKHQLNLRAAVNI